MKADSILKKVKQELEHWRYTVCPAEEDRQSFESEVLQRCLDLVTTPKSKK